MKANKIVQKSCKLILGAAQVEQEELKLHQHCKGHSNLGSMAQHTCQEVSALLPQLFYITCAELNTTESHNHLHALASLL